MTRGARDRGAVGGGRRPRSARAGKVGRIGERARAAMTAGGLVGARWGATAALIDPRGTGRARVPRPRRRRLWYEASTACDFSARSELGDLSRLFTDVAPSDTFVTPTRTPENNDGVRFLSERRIVVGARRAPGRTPTRARSEPLGARRRPRPWPRPSPRPPPAPSSRLARLLNAPRIVIRFVARRPRGARRGRATGITPRPAARRSAARRFRWTRTRAGTARPAARL